MLQTGNCQERIPPVRLGSYVACDERVWPPADGALYSCDTVSFASGTKAGSRSVSVIVTVIWAFIGIIGCESQRFEFAASAPSSASLSTDDIKGTDTHQVACYDGNHVEGVEIFNWCCMSTSCWPVA